MSFLRNKHFRAVGAALLALGLTAAPAAASNFWFITPVTPYGEKVDFLYQVLMWISAAILILVEVALVAALVKFRKKPGENREPATWAHNTTLEIVWTAVPFILLVAILIPTYQALAALATIPEGPKVLRLEIVGHQFYWEYRYPDLGVTFNSTPRDAKGGYGEPLEIPVQKQVKVVMTAADVIHAWWVPAFSMQQMTTPGNLATVPLFIKEEGDYKGNCAYLCGPQHGAMGIYVKAVKDADFNTWVAAHKAPGQLKTIETLGQIAQTPAPPEANNKAAEEAEKAKAANGGDAPLTPEKIKDMSEKGAAIYAAKCAGCHQATGAGVPGVFPPLDGSEFVNGPEKELLGIIEHGKSGQITVKGQSFNSSMGPMGAGLSDVELAQLATYVRSAWSNKSKPVSPAQVKSMK